MRTGSGNGRLADPLLTDLGHRQAQVLANYLARPVAPVAGVEGDRNIVAHNRNGYMFTHLYCSLMVRAVQTGSYIAEALDLPLAAWECIHERGGIYLRNPETEVREGLPGPNRAFFEAEYPHLKLPDNLGAAGWWNRPYEETSLALERARHFLQTLIARHGNSQDQVAIVSHGGFYQSIMSILLDAGLNTQLEASQFVWFKFNNGAITRITFMDDHVEVSYQNRIDFMPSDILT